jgi:WhiB family redox-sensing transcriptional regulator
MSTGANGFGFRHDPWVADAACNGLDPDMFFPDKGESSGPAKQVCAACPVREDCLTMAVELNLTSGIFGGMSARDRRKVRRERGLAPPLPPRPERCVNGHPLTDETSARTHWGGWRCRTCDAGYQRRAAARRRAEAEKFDPGYWERRGLRVVNGGKR